MLNSVCPGQSVLHKNAITAHTMYGKWDYTWLVRGAEYQQRALFGANGDERILEGVKK